MVQLDAIRSGSRRGSYIDHFSYRGQHLVGEDFSGQRFNRFDVNGCYFEGCCFDGAVINNLSSGLSWHVTEFVGCSFDGANIDKVFGCLSFVDCSFDGTLIRNWRSKDAELVNCSFSGRIQDVVFEGKASLDNRAYLQRDINQFERNDFSQATLSRCSFRGGIDLTKQRLPMGPEYVYLADAPKAVSRAREAVDLWDDVRARLEASVLLEVYEEYVASGQQQLLLRVADFPFSRIEPLQRLLNELRGC